MSCQSSKRSERATEGAPGHNWRPTVVHGAAAWLLVGLAATVVQGGPVELGVTVAGVFVAPVLPVALYCDYHQARAADACAPGLVAYGRNLARDLLTTLIAREPLGNGRTRFDC
ncbi:hypothetical protein [Haloarcula laminariae]|uniref:hypothetical protein n=1 Tax=Haloarcula laminariae TaxID=2961577 RepID=UPI002406B173|nr:hypothetical protein [Halomicroarcula sp. FL173]